MLAATAGTATKSSCECDRGIRATKHFASAVGAVGAAPAPAGGVTGGFVCCMLWLGNTASVANEWLQPPDLSGIRPVHRLPQIPIVLQPQPEVS